MSSDLVKEGYLTKSPPPGKMKGWKKRWFRFRKATSQSKPRLEYYESQQSANKGEQPKGVINLNDCLSIKEGDCQPQKNYYLFNVETSDRVYQLLCADKQEMDDWIQTLCGELFAAPVTASALPSATPPSAAPPAKPTAFSPPQTQSPPQEENGNETPWLFGPMSREESEAILRDNGVVDGLFLVRESTSKKGSYALSVAWGGKLVHHLLGQGQDGLFEFNKVPMGSITTLVDAIAFLKVMRPEIAWKSTLSTWPPQPGSAAPTSPSPSSGQMFAAAVNDSSDVRQLGLAVGTPCLLRVNPSVLSVLESASRREITSWSLGTIEAFGCDASSLRLKVSNVPNAGSYDFATTSGEEIASILREHTSAHPLERKPTIQPRVPRKDTSAASSASVAAAASAAAAATEATPAGAGTAAPPRPVERKKSSDGTDSATSSAPPTAALPPKPAVANRASRLFDESVQKAAQEAAGGDDGSQGAPKTAKKPFIPPSSASQDMLAAAMAAVNTGAPKLKPAASKPDLAPKPEVGKKPELAAKPPAVTPTKPAPAPPASSSAGSASASPPKITAPKPAAAAAATPAATPAAKPSPAAKAPAPVAPKAAATTAASPPKQRPSAPTAAAPSLPPGVELFRAACPYDAPPAEKKLSFKEGDILRITTKDPAGWWMAELDGRQGWVPEAYLDPYTPLASAVAPSDNYSSGDDDEDEGAPPPPIPKNKPKPAAAAPAPAAAPAAKPAGGRPPPQAAKAPPPTSGAGRGPAAKPPAPAPKEDEPNEYEEPEDTVNSKDGHSEYEDVSRHSGNNDNDDDEYEDVNSKPADSRNMVKQVQNMRKGAAPPPGKR